MYKILSFNLTLLNNYRNCKIQSTYLASKIPYYFHLLLLTCRTIAVPKSGFETSFGGIVVELDCFHFVPFFQCVRWNLKCLKVKLLQIDFFTFFPLEFQNLTLCDTSKCPLFQTFLILCLLMILKWKILQHTHTEPFHFSSRDRLSNGHTGKGHSNLRAPNL